MAGHDPLGQDIRATSDDISAIVHRIPATSIPEAGVLGRWIDRLALIFAAGIVLAAAVLLTEVFLRYVFNSPTVWAHETSVFLSAIAFLYGGLLCAARDSHIRVVLIYDQLGVRMKRVFDVVISAISALAAAFFAYAAYFMARNSVFSPTGFRLETSGSAWNPPTPAILKVFSLLMLGVLTLQFVVLTVNHVKRLRQGDR